jgi:hypothetical protein
MTTQKHRRPTVPGDDKLGTAFIPAVRECISCNFKPIPIGFNCPNCGRNEIGEQSQAGNASGIAPRRVQERTEWDY